MTPDELRSFVTTLQQRRGNAAALASALDAGTPSKPRKAKPEPKYDTAGLDSLLGI